MAIEENPFKYTIIIKIAIKRKLINNFFLLEKLYSNIFNRIIQKDIIKIKNKVGKNQRCPTSNDNKER